MDKNRQLIRLSETGRFWRLNFEELSSAEQVYCAVWELESEVNSGGFAQYFSNSSGDTAFAVVDALKAIGADHTARIAAAANSLFPNSSPPRDSDDRQALLDALTDEERSTLDGLDEQFFRYPDNLGDLLHGFVARNSTMISGAVELGF